MQNWLFRALVALCLFSVSCAGGSDNASSTSTPVDSSGVTFQEPTLPQRDGDQVDRLQLVGLNAAGEVILGPIDGDENGMIHLEGDPPADLVSVRIDYLRNGGFALFRAEFPVQKDLHIYLDPQESPIDEQTSSYRLVPDGAGGFTVSQTLGGAPLITENTLQGKEAENFRIKGVCYAPAPINYNTHDGPSIGDLFWDTFQPVPGVNIYNWFALWGKGDLNPPNVARNDLDNIRKLGANTVRVYCTISRQLPGNKDQPFPAPLTGQHFTHKQFLDQCWNNGNHPLKVLVGIPIPDTVLYRYIENPAHTAFWEATLQETVNDLKDHPAVLGFTIMNEIDENRSAFPAGGANADSDFYYGRLKKYSDMVKQAAPDKLVGFAAHDFPDLVRFASTQPTTGPNYLEQLTSIDFYGVNVYQTVNYDSELADVPGSWGSLQGAARKPVIFTEMGFPATGHRDPGDPSTIYDDATTRAKTAEAVERMAKIGYANPLLLGLCYFEYSDEWWKQGQQTVWNGTTAAPVTFPNGFWDEEGFGLYSIQKGPGKNPTDPIFGEGPILPVDVHTERTEITAAVKRVFDSVSSAP